MSQDQWTAVDSYISDTLIPADAALDAALKASNAAGLPEIQVSAAQGKMLHLLARMKGARRILEVGTLGGYSTIWLARALPAGGRLITLELDSRHAAVAQSNFERAGLGSVIELRLGKAAESMQQLVSEGGGPFDLIFIDADKEGYPEYFRWALKLSQPGTVIIADNMVRKGALPDAASTDPMVQGVRRFNGLVAAEPRVTATIVQTVGSKGYDGFALVLVVS